MAAPGVAEVSVTSTEFTNTPSSGLNVGSDASSTNAGDAATTLAVIWSANALAFTTVPVVDRVIGPVNAGELTVGSTPERV